MGTSTAKKPGAVEAEPGLRNAFQNNASTDYTLSTDASLAILHELQAGVERLTAAITRMQAAADQAVTK